MNYNFQDSKPEIDDSAYIAPGARLIGDVKIESDCNIWPNAVLRGDLNTITIKSSSNIQDNATIHVEKDQIVSVGRNVTVGHSAIIHGCIIGDKCLIGMGSTILNGAKIGKGSIIGANALVPENKEIPPNSLVVGLPGKVIRETTKEERERITDSAKHYVDLSKEHKSSN